MISIVVCSIDPAKLERFTASCARALGDDAHEIIAIHDARSLCEGYNRGLARVRGDICVFAHDDIEILTPRLGAVLAGHLASFELVGVAGTRCMVDMNWASAGIAHAYGAIAAPAGDGYELQLFGAPAAINDGIVALDGVFIAARRDVAQAVEFDAETFDGWHGYDADFTFRCHRAGHRAAVCLDLQLIHFSSGRVGKDWLRYAERFCRKHAGALDGRAGPWLDVRKRVATRDALRAAWDACELAVATADVRRRVTSVA